MRRLVVAAPPAVHVTTPRGHATPRRGVILHRTPLAASDIKPLDGLPVTSALRTLHDLAASVGPPPLTRAIDRAIARGLVSPIGLRRSLEPGRCGGAALGHALDAVPGMIRSEAERRLVILLRRAELPLPGTNVRVLGYEVDALWPRERLIVGSTATRSTPVPGRSWATGAATPTSLRPATERFDSPGGI